MFSSSTKHFSEITESFLLFVGLSLSRIFKWLVKRPSQPTPLQQVQLSCNSAVAVFSYHLLLGQTLIASYSFPPHIWAAFSLIMVLLALCYTALVDTQVLFLSIFRNCIHMFLSYTQCIFYGIFLRARDRKLFVKDKIINPFFVIIQCLLKLFTSTILKQKSSHR